MSFLDFALYAQLPHAFWSLFIFLGAAIGSFFNVLAMRWPAVQIGINNSEAKAWIELNKGKVSGIAEFSHMPLLSGRSHCPCCKKKIPWYHNIPLISWLVLRGKSSCCQRPIRFVYLGMEILGAGVFAAIALTVGPTVPGLILGIIAMLMVVMARIDASEGFVPDALLFCTMAMAYLFSLTELGVGADEAVLSHLAVFFGLYCVLQSVTWFTQAQPMGMADYHLFSISAVLLGYHVFWVFAAFLPLLVVTLAAKSLLKWEPGLFAKLVGSKALPAGPAIVAATLLVASLEVTGVIV